MFLLQDNSFDRTCSHVIYAPVDINSVNVVFNGGDPNIIALFPSGFVILPDGVQLSNEGSTVNSIGCRGCLLTISFQILVGLNPALRIENGWVEAVVNLVENTAERIKVAMAWKKGSRVWELTLLDECGSLYVPWELCKIFMLFCCGVHENF